MKMSLKEFNLAVMNLHSRINLTNRVDDVPTEDIMVEFHLTDRDGMHHRADEVESMTYNVLDPKKVVITLS